MARETGQDKGDISTLPEGRHFYFALTYLLIFLHSLQENDTIFQPIWYTGVMRMPLLLRGCVSVVALLVSPAFCFAQSIYSVTIDTSQVRNSSGKLVFDITSNRPLLNRADIVNFVTDGTTGLPETEGTLVSGDLIQGSNPAKLTRMKAYTFFTELAIPFTAFGDTISFVLNVSETGPREGNPPDQLAVYLLDDQGRRLMRPHARDTKPDFSVTISGDRGGKLEISRRSEQGAGGQAGDVDAANDARASANSRIGIQVTPAWTPDDPALDRNAKTFEGSLTEFCNRRCDGALICTGGAFGIQVDEDTFYTFDDIGNLKTQVAVVDSGKNPLGEGAVGRARVTGTLDGSVLSVRKVEVF